MAFLGRLRLHGGDSSLPVIYPPRTSLHQTDEPAKSIFNESALQLWQTRQRLCSTYHDKQTHQTVIADARLDDIPNLCHLLSLNTRPRHITGHLILKAYQKWQNDCVNFLTGDFSFIIIQHQTRHVFCARDAIGIKPLYYALTNTHFIFSTELVYLKQLSDSNKLDDQFIASLLVAKEGSRPSQTAFSDSKRLPAGHTLYLKHSNLSISRYWHPENLPIIHYNNPQEYEEQLREIVGIAVDNRISLTQQTGVHLTGGLDSSSVAAFMMQSNQLLKTVSSKGFCWQPIPQRNEQSELEYQLISSMCEQYSFNPVFQDINDTQTLNFFQSDSLYRPISDTLFHEQFSQIQARKAGIGVILSGWGGDEGITGHGKGLYPELLLNGLWKQLWQLSLAQEKNRFPLRTILNRALLPILPTGIQDSFGSLKNRIKGRSNSGTRHYLNDHYKPLVQPLSHLFRYTSVRDYQISLFRSSLLVDRIESWYSYGMEQGIDYRYPLLDRKVVEFALSLPSEHFQNNRGKRVLMRKAMSPLLPKQVCWNTDKNDVFRSKSHIQSANKALLKIGTHLKKLDQPPERSIYLNYPKLVSDLTEERLQSGKVGIGKLTRAIQFLDFPKLS